LSGHTAVSPAGHTAAKDVELVQQQFDMLALLNREIDAAEAMTYNEYAQVLEAINP
jgi:NitT/TauT family transport system substrate-binding protein